MSDMPEWFSTDTAAAYIGVTAATLRRLVERGEVPAFPHRAGAPLPTLRPRLLLESARVEPEAQKAADARRRTPAKNRWPTAYGPPPVSARAVGA